MKTKNEYLKNGIFPLIFILLILNAAKGFSEILLLPIVQFIYIAISAYKYASIIVQFFFATGVLLIVAGVIRLNLTSKMNKQRFYFNDILSISFDLII